MGVCVNNSLTLWNVFSSGSLQTEIVSFFKSYNIGCCNSAKFGTYLPKYCVISRNLFSSGIEESGGNFSIASILSLLGCIPFYDIMYPKYRIILFLNSQFPGFNFIPDSSINFNISSSLLSSPSIVLPCIKMSIITWTPSMSPSNSVIQRWKISGAEDIPNGNLLKQNLPNGVIKVVSNWLSLSNRIWWNPLVHIILRIFSNPLIWVMYPPNLVAWNVPFLLLNLIFKISSHILTSLFFFLLEQWVSINPLVRWLFRQCHLPLSVETLFFTLSKSGKGIRWAVVVLYGTTFSRSVIFTGSPFIYPFTLATTAIRSISYAVSLDNKLSVLLSITCILKWNVLFLCVVFTQNFPLQVNVPPGLL